MVAVAEGDKVHSPIRQHRVIIAVAYGNARRIVLGHGGIHKVTSAVTKCNAIIATAI